METAKATLAAATAKTKALLAAAQIGAALLRSGPLRESADDIRRCTEQVLAVVRSGHLDTDGLTSLSEAACIAEAAFARIERFAVLPGAAGRVAAAAGLLRLPLRLWVRWVARDQADPKRPAPVEAACLPAETAAR